MLVGLFVFPVRRSDFKDTRKRGHKVYGLREKNLEERALASK